MSFDSTDVPELIRAYHSLNWKEKNYLDRKISLIRQIGSVSSVESAVSLKNVYYAAEDTIQIQMAALEALLKVGTQHAYSLFGSIMVSDPPVVINSSRNLRQYPPLSALSDQSTNVEYSDNRFFDELSDSLALTKTIIEDLLPLINLDDYENQIIRLIRAMVNDSLLTPKDYSAYFSRFLLEARQELKRNKILEKQSDIQEAEAKKDDEYSENRITGNQRERGNDRLLTYATLLLPFAEKEPGVMQFVNQLLQLNNHRTKYNTMLLLLKQNKDVPDSLISYFAELDDYRYELYRDLVLLDMRNRMTGKFRDRQLLAKSKLYYYSFSKPDSLVLLDSLPAYVKDDSGWIYFYKYKQQKEDLVWKIATVGLLSNDSRKFEVNESLESDEEIGDGSRISYYAWQYQRKDSFTSLTDSRLKEDEPVKPMLEKELRRIVLSQYRSGKEFFTGNEGFGQVPFQLRLR